MKPNYNASLRFLMQFHPNRRWVLTAINPTDKGIVTATFDEARFLEAQQWLQKYGELHYGLYFSPNPPDVDVSKKPTKAQTTTAYYLHCDCDPKEGADVEAEQTRFIEALISFTPIPSVIVKSGNGIHGYWRLAETTAEIAVVEAANKVLEKQFTGGTQTWNVDRIMRLPGTINYPNAKKLAAGRTESLAELVSFNEHSYALNCFNTTVLPATRKSSNLSKDSKIDRSPLVFGKCVSLIKSGKSDEEIKAFFLNPEEKLGDRIRERPDPMAFMEAELERARKKSSDDAVRAYKFEANKDWPALGKEGDPLPTKANLQYGLEKIGASVYFDDFAQRTYLCGVRDFPEICKLEDYPRNRVKLDIEELPGPRYEEQRFNQMLEDIAHENRCNPVLDYLDGLKWDGVKRLDRWLQTYLQAEDSEYARAVGRIHLIAAVRRARQPGCKYDTMVIFVSPQGYGKSTAVEILAKESRWFAGDMNLNSDPKQLIESMHGKWIIECAEMKGNSKAEVSTVKGLLSRTQDIARMSYDHFPKEVPRKSVFFGSTNDRKFLYDPTGARRFWPVDVGEVDLAGLKRNVDQLWAEAVEAERANESIVLSQHLWDIAAVEQEKATLNSPMFDVLENMLYGLEGKLLGEQLWNATGFNDMKGRGIQQNTWITQAMQKLGWEKQHVKWNGKPQSCWVKGNPTISLIFRILPSGGYTVDEIRD